MNEANHAHETISAKTAIYFVLTILGFIGILLVLQGHRGLDPDSASAHTNVITTIAELDPAQCEHWNPKMNELQADALRSCAMQTNADQQDAVREIIEYRYAQSMPSRVQEGPNHCAAKARKMEHHCPGAFQSLPENERDILGLN